jgi:hypothetical protein
VIRRRGQDCGDIELTGFLVNVADSVPSVMDLHIVHERWGSSSDTTLHGNLHYPNDVDRSLNEVATDKIRKYYTDYKNNPSNDISFMTPVASTSGRLHNEFALLLFLQTHRETDLFFASSGFHLAQSTSVSSQLKTKVGSTLAKTVVLRVNLNLDGTSITSRTYTHPSHSQTSRLLTSSLSLDVPVPQATQCM